MIKKLHPIEKYFNFWHQKENIKVLFFNIKLAYFWTFILTLDRIIHGQDYILKLLGSKAFSILHNQPALLTYLPWPSFFYYGVQISLVLLCLHQLIFNYSRKLMILTFVLFFISTQLSYIYWYHADSVLLIWLFSLSFQHGLPEKSTFGFKLLKLHLSIMLFNNAFYKLFDNAWFKGHGLYNTLIHSYYFTEILDFKNESWSLTFFSNVTLFGSIIIILATFSLYTQTYRIIALNIIAGFYLLQMLFLGQTVHALIMISFISCFLKDIPTNLKGKDQR